jgi:predicted esterase
MNIYQPTGDTLSERPLMILAFGGAFVFGSKTSPDIVYLCEEFAKLGYVTAAIDYRLTTALISQGNQQLATFAVLKASHDMRAAIRFFYKDAATANSYKIDTSRIFIGGVSAGALAALHTAYLDQLNEIPSIIASDTTGIGGIEGLSGNPGYSSEVAGVVNLCGALNDVTLIEPNDPVLVSLHGTEDGTVPYGQDTVTLFNLNLEVAGSGAIHGHLDTANLNVDHALYTWQGAGHTPFVGFSGIVPTFMDTTFRFVRDFLYDQQCGAMVSIDPEQNAIAIQAFPNPSAGDFYLKFPTGISPQIQIHVFDAMGRKIPVQTNRRGDLLQIKCHQWTPGIYVWKVLDDTGKPIGSGKLIHQ